MTENQELINEVKPEKRPKGRPRKYIDGARAHRDSKRSTLINRERLNELLEIERKYLEIKKIL